MLPRFRFATQNSAANRASHVSFAIALATALIIALLSGPGFAQTAANSASLQTTDDGVTRIGVVLFDGVLTSDVTAPLEVFGAAVASEAVENFEVVTIAPENKKIRTHEGITLVADYDIENAPALDVILVGSSYDMDVLLENKAFMAFIEERGAVADCVASNCSGAYVLAAAGLLDGLEATTYPGGELWLKVNRPSVKIRFNETVVIDGNAITSNGSMVSYAAAFALLEKLAGENTANEISELLYYDRLLKHSVAAAQ